MSDTPKPIGQPPVATVAAPTTTAAAAPPFSRSQAAVAEIAENQTIRELRERIAQLEKSQSARAKAIESPVLDIKASTGEMPVADCRVHLDKLQDVPKYGVTPAEVVILIAQFHQQKGDMPIHSLVPHVVTTPKLDANKKIVRNEETFVALLDTKEVKTVKRLAHQEVGRLKGKYGAAKVEAVFPGANPNLPETFRVALQMGMSVAIPGATLTKDQGGDNLGSIVINA